MLEAEIEILSWVGRIFPNILNSISTNLIFCFNFTFLWLGIFRQDKVDVVREYTARAIEQAVIEKKLMLEKIYRNGKPIPDSAMKTASINLWVFLIAGGMGHMVDRWLKHVFEDSEIQITVKISIVAYGIFVAIGLLVYLYKTITRLRPLAFIKGDIMVVNVGLFWNKEVDLGKSPKIVFQYCSEHDQRMKIKYPNKMPIEFIIRQTNCTTEDLAKFVTKNHSVDVRYS